MSRGLPALVVAAAAVSVVLLAACGDTATTGPSGVTTATPRGSQEPSDVTATSAMGAATPTSTPSPGRTASPLVTAEPTESEQLLAALVGEDPAQIAGAVVRLLEQCSDSREELANSAERTWRVLNEQRNIRAPVTAILGRVIASLPVDGRTVACESLFASVVTELTR